MLSVLDLFMAKAAANREKDREFNMSLLRFGYVKAAAAIHMVASMPVDDKESETCAHASGGG